MKKALLVGINDYQGEINDLPSCVEDTLQFKKILSEQYGFAEANLRTLHDREATVGRVQQEFEWLTAGVQPNDTLVLFYSGHGCQVPKDDTLEEALVLYDQPLFDDLLVQMSTDLPPGVLTVILDSCFSGGMEKPFRVAVTGSDEGIYYARVKYWTPPIQKSVELARADESLKFWRPFGASGRRVRRFDPATGSLNRTVLKDEVTSARLNAILFSACQENETAAASTPATTGMSAFTYALTQGVRRSGNKQSNHELYQNAASLLTALRFRQTPMLLCPTMPVNSETRPFIGLAEVSVAPTSSALSEIIAGLRNRRTRTASKAQAVDVPQMSADEALDAVLQLAPDMATLPDTSMVEKSFWTRINRALRPLADNPMARTLVSTLGSSVLGLSKGQEPDVMSPHEALEAVALIAPALAESSPDDKSFWTSLGGALRSVVRNPIVRSVGEQVAGSLLKGQQRPTLLPDEAIEAVAALAPVLATAKTASPMEKGFWSSVAGALQSIVRNPAVRAIGEQFIGSLSKGQEPAAISSQEALEAVAALAPTLAAVEGASAVEKGFWSSVAGALRSVVRNPVMRSLADAAGANVLRALGKGQAAPELTPEEAIEAIATLAPTLAAAEGITAREKGFWTSVGHALGSAIHNPLVHAMSSQVLAGLTKGQAPEALSPEEALEAVATLAPVLAAAEGTSPMEKGFWSSISSALSSVIRNPVVRTAVSVVGPRVLGSVIPGGTIASIAVPAVISAISKNNGVSTAMA